MTSEILLDHTVFDEILLREARKLVTAYDFSGDIEVSVLVQGENTILLVDDRGRGKKYVLRISSHRLIYHNGPSIASEVMWLRALRRDSDIEAPDPIPDRQGRFVQTLEASDLDRPRCAVMFSFLDGVEPNPNTLMADFAQLGEITARMHRHAQSWTPPAEFARHSWTPDSIFTNQVSWGHWEEGMDVDADARAILGRMADVVARRLGRLPRDKERFGLIHADLRLANILVEGDRAKVIDFDDCGSSYYLYDLATALSLLQERPDAPELTATWLDGYRRVASIPPDIEAEIPSFNMLRRLAEVAWFGRCRGIEFFDEIGPAHTAATIQLADDYLTKYA